MQVIESHGARIPVIGFGTMTLKEDLCVELVEAALHLGYRHLDTAQNYGNEREVGAGMRASGVKREDVFLTTKVWFNRLAAGDLERSVDESLERLALPWVDLLLIHWPNAQIPLAESIARAVQGQTRRARQAYRRRQFQHRHDRRGAETRRASRWPCCRSKRTRTSIKQKS